jgi:antitoxin VapB
MPIQIANPKVVAKIERLAAASGLTKTAAVEKAVDAMLAMRPTSEASDKKARFRAILAQLDRIPDREDAFDPLEWDEHGLPR